MARIQTVATVVGVAAGALTIGGVYLFGVGQACGGGFFPPSVALSCPAFSVFSPWPEIVQAVAAVLILVSLVSYIGPRKFFYGSAVLSALLAILVQESVLNPSVLFTFGLAIAAVVLCVVAARWEARVSEQSNPMNLPVFG
jgi:hypothetical protein